MSKAIVTAAFALSLLCGTSAMAADQHDDHHAGGGGGGGAQHGGGGAPRNAGVAHYSAPTGGGGSPRYSGGGGAPHTVTQLCCSGEHYTGGGQYPHRGASQFTGGGGGGAQTQQFSHQQGGQYRGQDHNQGGYGQDAYRGGGRDDGGRHDDAYRGGGGNHGERGRYNERDFPHALQAERQFHWRGDWNPPRGFYYRHWGYGDRLPYGWFGRDFWILDFGLYGLPPAPYGYAWVREGPDAVMVNVYDGQVVEVEYGVFY